MISEQAPEKLLQILSLPIEEVKEALREFLLERAVLRGDFTLASGRKSSYYVDGKKVSLSPEGLFYVCRLMLEHSREREIQAFGGPTLGADPIVGGMTLLSHLYGFPLSGFIVRKETKEHGTGKRIEGHIPPGARVAMVEDVVTTGGSLLSAVEAVRAETDAQVVLLMALLDREEGGTEAIAQAGYEFLPLFTKSELGL